LDKPHRRRRKCSSGRSLQNRQHPNTPLFTTTNNNNDDDDDDDDDGRLSTHNTIARCLYRLNLTMIIYFSQNTNIKNTKSQPVNKWHTNRRQRSGKLIPTQIPDAGSSRQLPLILIKPYKYLRPLHCPTKLGIVPVKLLLFNVLQSSIKKLTDTL
jgi:hypothetical protein